VTGDELKRRREALGLSLAVLAEKLGVKDRGTIYRWEHGKRRIPPMLDRALQTIESESKGPRTKE